ncbi:rhodanese-like domain-containing protein [Desulfogranum marinum]|uniref:rhodanese-like domain-containing protein n=1 Tax=Desulfogranum marinum TaxID=453220 RepID=UPI0029C80560|nr:rhodanese-like domain-containing protein [Desulfogranum marinum]
MEAEYQNISVEQVKKMTGSQHEKKYVLVDVRQENEYQNEHIPGATLIPLAELAEREAELPADRPLIFYCRSGKRSQAAATLIASSRSGSDQKNELYNMVGGIMAWNGMLLSGIPDLKTFTQAESVGRVFHQALELERGAERFYTALLGQVKEEKLKKPLATLARAEEGHARTLHRHWAALEKDVAPFDEIYGQLTGDIVEGNQDIEALLDFFEANMERPCLTAMEMALQIECMAYDMYRNLAHNFRDKPLAEVFLDIAQSEKSHIQIAAESIALCP